MDLSFEAVARAAYNRQPAVGVRTLSRSCNALTCFRASADGRGSMGSGRRHPAQWSPAGRRRRRVCGGGVQRAGGPGHRRHQHQRRLPHPGAGQHDLHGHIYRTNLRGGPEREHPAWAAVTLFNYSDGISRESGHVVRGNRVAYREAGGTPFIKKTEPPDTLIESNAWPATFSLADLLGRELP